MQLFGIWQSREASVSMIGNSVKSAVYGIPQSLLDGSHLPLLSIVDNEKPKILSSDNEDLSAVLGVTKRPAAEENSALQLETLLR